MPVSLVVNIERQRMYLVEGTSIIKTYPVSTSKYGTGSRMNSNRTPLGRHRIVSKIGRGAPINSIFKNCRNTYRRARVNTGTEDHITTRVLRLQGLQPGKNRGCGIDSYERRIYIHGTPHEDAIGTPASHGCVRMRNADIIDLFGRVPRGTLVDIIEE